MDYQHFRSRGDESREKEVFDVTVLRDGNEKLIKNTDLVVGDILVLTKDVIVAADGLLFADNGLFINEEVVTGESKPIKKKLIKDSFCQSGTQVTDGSGRMLVTAVGEDTGLGQTMRTITDSIDYEGERMAEERSFLSWFNGAAFFLGVLSFIVLLIRWTALKKGFPINEISDQGPVHFLILAIDVVLVELPEGFFLVVAFAQIYLTWISVKDKIHIHSSDVFLRMSSVKSICFDKTGTLTENKMAVVEGWFQGMYFHHVPSGEELDPTILELITENLSLNSEGFFNVKDDGSIKFVGNQTECALLGMTEKLGVDHSNVKLQNRPHIIKNYAFNSDKKMSSVIVRREDLLRLYNKGAAEMVLHKCTEYIDPSGSRNPISVNKQIELEDTIEAMAAHGLRTLALTYKDFDRNEFSFSENGEPLDESLDGKRGFAGAPEENLVLVAIVGIKDPIRKGVSEVVEQFKKVGISTRMITGDSLETAKKIAKECGILTNGLAIEGAKFRKMVEEEDIESFKHDLEKLQVLARSSPSDKQFLVQLLRSLGEEVAVSGDGTNDARAMAESTVGFAMGVNSTAVAREAADVVVLNDNISSILTFYLWSRRLQLSFWGYFQFRSSVTFVVWIVVLVSVCVGGETPLDAHQFLWANFTIDMMIALTFATESPPEKVPGDDSYHQARKPVGSASFVYHVRRQALYQIIIIICTFHSLFSISERYKFPVEDEFYYHYCHEDPNMEARYGDSLVGPLCAKYLDCDHSTRYCTLFEEKRLDDLSLDHDFRDHIIDEYKAEHDMVKMRKSSLIFNMFIFMQLFNTLNCRDVLKDHSIFEGLFNSPLSCAIRLITISLQLMIMLTPVRTLFKVTELNAWEWLYSMAVSILVVPLSTLLRTVTRGED